MSEQPTRDRMVPANLTLPATLLTRVEGYARRHGQSRAAVLRLALTHGLEFLETWEAPK